jgi:hypothetical protein
VIAPVRTASYRADPLLAVSPASRTSRTISRTVDPLRADVLDPGSRVVLLGRGRCGADRSPSDQRIEPFVLVVRFSATDAARAVERWVHLEEVGPRGIGVGLGPQLSGQVKNRSSSTSSLEPIWKPLVVNNGTSTRSGK